MEAGEVARELDTSVETVRKRFARARAVLGVSSTKEAARLLAVHEGRLDQQRVYPRLVMEAEEEPGLVKAPAASRWWDRTNELSGVGWAWGIVLCTIAALLAFLAAVGSLNGLQTLMPRGLVLR